MKNNKSLIIFATVLIIGFLGVAQNTNNVFAQAQDTKEQKTESVAQSSNQDMLVTIEQLRKQIKELQDQLAKLTSEVAVVKEEIQITKELYKGVSGNEVKEVQKFLKQFSKEIYPEGLVTGYYGPLTEKAVKKFQEREGLEPTGKIDEITKKSINEYLSEGRKKSESAATKPADVSVKLGTPTIENKELAIPSVSGIVQVTGAGKNGVLCVLAKDGLVYCRYESGDFLKGAKAIYVGGFVAVPGLTNVASITSFGDNRICAVKTDGSALCWGNNSYGQLGDGTLVAKAEPTQVFGLGPGTTASISMGMLHTCALKIDGSVVCWGSNDSLSGGGGQIGHNDKTDTIRLFPTQVFGLGPKSTTALSSSDKGTCAIKTDSSVVCWGETPPIGHSGTYAPVKIPQNLGAIKSLTIGWKTTFALKSNGSVVGWGQNYCGQLGNGRQQTGSPTQVTGLGPGSTAAIATNFMRSCALKTDGSVVCWGCDGATGDGTILNRYTPVQPVGLGAGTTAAISDNASCAIKTDNSVVCWAGGQIPTSVPGLK